MGLRISTGGRNGERKVLHRSAVGTPGQRPGLYTTVLDGNAVKGGVAVPATAKQLNKAFDFRYANLRSFGKLRMTKT
jgi:hypothetical protein